MGLASQADVSGSPRPRLFFWTRFWDDRALDYARTAVGRTMARLLNHGSDLRERDLTALDTFALPELIRAMAATTDRTTLARLTRIARHATERGPLVAEDASPDEVRRAVGDWLEWWFVHGRDFVVLDGAHGIIASLTETRYGKWLRRASSGELGLSAIDGEPIGAKLRARAPVTLLVCGLAMLVSWSLAVPIGALGAWRRGGRSTLVSSGRDVRPVRDSGRSAWRSSCGGSPRRTTWAVGGSRSLWPPWRRARWRPRRGGSEQAMLDVVGQDFVRTAHAKGVPGWRVLIVHALRNALIPTLSLAGLHLPALLGGTLVVEEVFALPGLGFETLRAVEAHRLGVAHGGHPSRRRRP